MGTRLIPHCTLEHLILSYNMLGSDGVPDLLRNFGRNASLRTLDLSYNGISSYEGWHAVGRAMKLHTGLETLILRGNTFTKEGASAFADGFSFNQSVTMLDISSTSAEADALLELCKSLAEQKRVRRLNAAENNLVRCVIIGTGVIGTNITGGGTRWCGDEQRDGYAFGFLLRNLPTLEWLDVSSNNMIDASGVDFGKVR